MSYPFVDFVTFLVSTERKFNIRDIIVLNKLTLTQCPLWHSSVLCEFLDRKESRITSELNFINHIQIEYYPSCFQVHLTHVETREASITRYSPVVGIFYLT